MAFNKRPMWSENIEWIEDTEPDYNETTWNRNYRSEIRDTPFAEEEVGDSASRNDAVLIQRKTKIDDDIRKIAHDLDISKSKAEYLQRLRGFEIVIVCDDSGSMDTPVDGTQRTRWHELCTIVKSIIEIGVLFDSNGVDIHFLHRQSYNNVKDPATVDRAFESPPGGYTPLVPVLKRIFTSNLAQRGRDKKLLVFVATDGLPTDNDGNDNLDAFRDVMENTRLKDTTYVSFLLCTDEEKCVKYMRQWDSNMENVDVNDDFNTEIARIRECQRNPNYSFSHGDYIIKALVGAIVPELDNLDEF